MTITLNIDCLLELVKAALLVVRFEFQIPNYILSKDDVLARVSITPQMTKIVKIAKVAKSITPETYKKQRKHRFRKHGCS